MTGAAVALQSNDIMTTFSTLSDGILVETFTTPTTSSTLPDPTHASDFPGFEGILFDELRIENSREIFQIDNLQTSVVLTPGLIPMAAGFLTTLQDFLEVEPASGVRF